MAIDIKIKKSVNIQISEHFLQMFIDGEIITTFHFDEVERHENDYHFKLHGGLIGIMDAKYMPEDSMHYKTLK